MAQFFFEYGAMGSGKTIEILKVAHNYEIQGRKVMLMTSAVDTRSGQGVVASRIGLSREARVIEDDMNLFDYIKRLNQEDMDKDGQPLAAVLIDEAQFLKKHQVIECARIVDELHIPVMAFGLKNDFQNHLFEGSEYLLLYADKIE